MDAIDWIVSISSTLFRLLSLVFLRVIPLTFCKTVLPILYMLHASFLLLSPDSASQHRPLRLDSTSGQSRDDKKNPLHSATSLYRLILALLFTLPSPTVSLPTRKASFFINTIVLLFVADFVTHPIRYPARDVTFVRVGAVEHNSAKLSMRFPGQGADRVHTVQIMFRSLVNDTDERTHWINGPTVDLFGESDWVNTTLIPNLSPNTSYEYKLAFPASNHYVSRLPAKPLRFKTFPDPSLKQGVKFRFIATSCILPNFHYVPGSGDQIKGFDLIAEYLGREKGLAESSIGLCGPGISDEMVRKADSSVYKFICSEAASTKFLLLLGDFIYADVPVYYGDSLEAYRRLYRRVYASTSFRKIYETLPIFNIYDDHEILNNFAGLNDDLMYPYPNASGAFDLYNGQANYNHEFEGQYYYNFQHGDVAFFVLDTRRYRSELPTVDYPTILGNQQFRDLVAWLEEANQTSTLKFIVSSVPFTTLWQHDAQTDSWAAFRHERSMLLNILHTIPNVFVLTGDRHEFAAIEFNGPFDWSNTIYEFSTSPLNMFYVPFFRTLNAESPGFVERTRAQSGMTSEGGTSETTREKYFIPEERVLRYLPTGNHKWTSFEIDTRDSSKPTIYAEVHIEGRVAYSWNKTGSPAPTRLPASTALLMPQAVQAFLEKIGLGLSRDRQVQRAN